MLRAIKKHNYWPLVQRSNRSGKKRTNERPSERKGRKNGTATKTLPNPIYTNPPTHPHSRPTVSWITLVGILWRWKKRFPWKLKSSTNTDLVETRLMVRATGPVQKPQRACQKLQLISMHNGNWKECGRWRMNCEYSEKYFQQSLLLFKCAVTVFKQRNINHKSKRIFRASVEHASTLLCEKGQAGKLWLLLLILIPAFITIL